MARWRLTPGRLAAVVKRLPLLDSYLLRQRRKMLAAGGGYPDWTTLTAKSPAWSTVGSHPGGPRVLMATSLGGHLPAMQMESVLAAALRLRGCLVDAVLCDGVLPACQLCEPRSFSSVNQLLTDGPASQLCDHCFAPGQTVFDTLGIRVHRYSSWLTPDDAIDAARLASATPMARLPDLETDHIPVGQHARAGALRFLARGTMEETPETEGVVRRYLEAALLTARAVERLIAAGHYDVAVFHHGIYVPQGIIGAVARRQGVRVVNWNPAYRRGCFIFSHDDSYHHTMLSEPMSSWDTMPWSRAREEQLMTYLSSRWYGSDDWISFQDRPYTDRTAIVERLGLDLSRPVVGCLTNVIWDAQLHFSSNAFSDMHEWLFETVRYFMQRRELQLVIRVHPAEIHGSVPSRQPVAEELRRAFGPLPDNIHVVPPDDRMSTYALCELCDAVTIYGTKTGIELAAMGIPVIVAGEAWVRGKGISMDAESPRAYQALLDLLPLGRRLDETVTRRARMYAYHLFFRRMIPVASLTPSNQWPPFSFTGPMEALLQGHDPGLDTIIRGILHGTPFTFDAAVSG